MAKKLTKAEQARLKRKHDMEIGFWGIAGAIILVASALGWINFAPVPEEPVDRGVVINMNSLTDMQIDDILDLFEERGEAIPGGKYAMSPDDLRDILEMVLKEDE